MTFYACFFDCNHLSHPWSVGLEFVMLFPHSLARNVHGIFGYTNLTRAAYSYPGLVPTRDPGSSMEKPDTVP